MNDVDSASDTVAPIKLLFVKEGRELYGAERATLRLLRCLEPRHVMVEVLVIEYHDTPSAFLTELRTLQAPVTIQTHRYGGAGGMIRAIRQRLEEGGHVAICTIGYKCDILGYLASKARHFRVSVMHGWVIYNTKLRLYASLNRFFLRRFGGILTCSTPLLAEARQLVGEKRAGCIFNGVDMIALSKASAGALPATLPADLGNEAPVLLYVGRFSPEKGVRFLISAFADTMADFTKMEKLGKLGAENAPILVLVGDGPDRAALEQQVAKLNLTERVYFAGEVENPYPIMQRARGLVLPSLSEGLPLVLIEALALGTPVIASQVGGVPDIVKHEENGLLVPPGKVPELKQAMLEFVTNRQRALQMGASGQTLVHHSFTDRQVADRFQKILHMWLRAYGARR